MAKIEDVANFFISMTDCDAGDLITNLKLNKLLYFAQGEYLARTKTPLFDDKIEAWNLGPVVPSVYQKYKVLGKNPIMTVDEDYSENNLSSEEIDILLDVLREYGKYQTSYLVKMTHEDNTPWTKVFDERKNNTIPLEFISEYFNEHGLTKPLEFDDAEFEGYRDDEGYIVLPKEDENEDWSEYDDL